jgi:uncharacterized protein YdaU (DUF1376 family)
MTSDVRVDIFMPIYVGDLLADTLHLSTEQFGAYMLLLLHQWRKGHYSEDEAAQIARLVGSSHLSASSSAKQELSRLLAPVLELLARDSQGQLYSRRNDEEKEKWTDRKRVFIERARKGGLGKAKKIREQKGNKTPASSTLEGMLDGCTSPSPTKNKSITSPTPPPAAEGMGRTPANSKQESERKAKTPVKPLGAPRRPPDKESHHPSTSGSATGKSTPKAPPPKPPVRPSKRESRQDGRFEPFMLEVSKYWRGLNPETPEFEWIRADRGALIDLLANAPGMQLAEFKRLLHNRRDSEVNPAAPPRAWLRDLREYSAGSLDRFKKQRRGSRTL